MLRLKRDLFAGLMFVAFGGWGLLAGYDLEAGTLSEMGPAYFPRIVSCLLILLGLGIAVSGLSRDAEPIRLPWSLRPVLMITLASLAFALLLERAGIVVAITTTILIGAFAGERPGWLTLFGLIVSLIIASIALFVWALGMQIQIWPRFIGS